MNKLGAIIFSLIFLSALALPAHGADPILLPNGFAITPLAAPRSTMLPLEVETAGRRRLALGQAVTTALSPDGTQLLVLTSGYNKDTSGKAADFPEYVFIYDVTEFPPRLAQSVAVPNSFCGMAWSPQGDEFYVSGGVEDSVYVFARKGLRYSRSAAIRLGHPTGLGMLSNLPAPYNASAPKPMTAGIAVNRSGTLAVVANFYNDSVSIVDLKQRKSVGEVDLRPGALDRAKTGIPGGEFPYWVAIRGDDRAYVSSPRDREVVVLDLAGKAAVVARIPIAGQPNRLLLNREQDKLYLAADNADAVFVISTKTNEVLGSIPVTAPAALLSAKNLPKGASPNSLAFSPDERTLYVTDGGINAVGVVQLDSSGLGALSALIPVGWYPNSVTVSRDGKYLYVSNSKGAAGPNPGNCRGDADVQERRDCAKLPNHYSLTLEHGGLWAAPVPPVAELNALTQRVGENNRFAAIQKPFGDPVMMELSKRIKHVIYVIKENRTYDQVLGDLEIGDGDPSLTEFPELATPNHHALARGFVTLDNFMDSGEVSGVGWNWSTAARTTDYTEKTVPPQYAGRGFSYDWEGMNRNVNVAYGSLADRIKAQPNLAALGAAADPNLLPGTADVAAPDSEFGNAGEGYLWDEVLRAGLTLRNYGMFCDLTRYDSPKVNPSYIPISKTPFADHIQQALPTKKVLIDRTDLFYRSFDQNNADYFLFKEWEREFDQFVQQKNLPSLSLVRLAHDHFGDFGTARFGINTPALQIADNDYALGLLIEKVSASPYKDDTLIFVVEDDAQDGPDHVDAHRSIAFVAGPYVKQRQVVSKRYTTVNMFHTIEIILGLHPSSLFSAAAEPMSEVFDLEQRAWTYHAAFSPILRSSELPLDSGTPASSPSAAAANYLARTRKVGYWSKRLGDMDYDEEDKLDTTRFNRELWKGMMGNRAYPTTRSGKNLRQRQDLPPL